MCFKRTNVSKLFTSYFLGSYSLVLEAITCGRVAELLVTAYHAGAFSKTVVLWHKLVLSLIVHRQHLAIAPCFLNAKVAPVEGPDPSDQYEGGQELKAPY